MCQRTLILVSFATLSMPSEQRLYAQSASRPVSSPYVTEALSTHYLAVAESAAVAPGERAVWQRRLDTARDTVENVLAWYANNGRGDEALRLLTPLGRFWAGPFLVSAFERALELPGTSPAIRARALNTAAAAAFRVKNQERTQKWANESIAIWRSLGNPAQTGRAYQRLVQLALRDGNHPLLRALADTGDLLCGQAHDEDCQAYFLNMRGESARVLKQYDAATVFYDQAGIIYARLSPVVQLGLLHNVGFTLLGGGHNIEGCRRFREGLGHALANGNRPYQPGMLAGLASCDAVGGNAASAAKLFGVSDAQLDRLGIVSDPADAVEYERYRTIARNQLGAVAFDSLVKAGRILPADSVFAARK